MNKTIIQELIAEGPDAVRPELEEYNVADQVAMMGALFDERVRVGMSLWDMEARSGISINSFYAWRSCTRSPTLCNAVAIAETLGFEVIMRHRKI